MHCKVDHLTGASSPVSLILFPFLLLSPSLQALSLPTLAKPFATVTRNICVMLAVVIQLVACEQIRLNVRTTVARALSLFSPIPHRCWSIERFPPMTISNVAPVLAYYPFRAVICCLPCNTGHGIVRCESQIRLRLPCLSPFQVGSCIYI